ncbi:hypothetical protein HYPSUDRAFT_40651 [Hypholoma sublateritium FD-334 SS-4]|uniref:Secreted protein n=1 Tax=Hypholoma sublateritium (strain FD-334 SS-4) TaxID=945553 RepID=A0A0D2MGT8_HYPSF|nr:hypothetical protein HYPSUDRAFT_40651 [Hypholoma sublateritium FD-334 SS-4]
MTQFINIIFMLSQVLAITALQLEADNVLTASRVYHTIIDQSPYMVDVTSVTTWTESASIIDTTLPTGAPTPTIVY